MSAAPAELTPLVEALKRAGDATGVQISAVRAAIAKKPADELRILKDSGIPDEALARARAAVLGLPYVDLREVDIPREVIALVPREIAEAHRAVAYAVEGNQLAVAMADPEDYAHVQAVTFFAEGKGMTARLGVTSEASLTAALRRYEEFGQEVEKALEIAKGKFSKEPVKGAEAAEGTIEEVIKGAPVSRMVSVIMRAAVEQGASDIHVEPFGKQTRVRYRVDGVLRTSLSLPAYIHGAIVSRVKVLANLRLDETRIPQDGRITQNLGGKVIDFRISTIPVVDNEKVVMRILDTSVGVPTLEQLGYRPENIELIKKEISQPHGLILVSGPTGSGKSTTLYTTLNMMNAEGQNVVTLEDPVEYYIKGVNQSQIRPEIGYTFASGLRALLRQDPNVIMVGEIRDKETAELAVHAALTGHLIFSTIHTNDVFGIIPRLMDLGVEPFLIAATINVGIAQRLARRICKDCKAPQDIPADIVERLRKDLKSVPPALLSDGITVDGPLVFYAGKGCTSCGNSGYQGRVSIAEILPITRDMQRIISSGAKPDELRAEARRQGMISLKQDGILKALAGITTVEEVLRISEEEDTE